MVKIGPLEPTAAARQNSRATVTRGPPREWELLTAGLVPS
jgi:hypothetical protein